MPSDDAIAALARRLTELEKWKQDQMIAAAVRAEQAKHIDERFDLLDKKVDAGFTRLDGLVSRIVWLIVGGFFTGIVAFVLKGGLTLVN